MKTVSYTNTSVEKDTAIVPPPVRICMHVLGIVRTDFRVMREATALVEAGFSVSIVDVESERTRPVEEDIRGVCVKHIIKPKWFIPTRFKPWFLIKAVQMIILGTMQLLRTQADIYHAHDVIALPACYIAAQLRRKPLIFDAHELPLSEPNLTRWHRLSALSRRLLAYLVPRCARVITTSPFYAQEIRRSYDCPELTLVRNFPAYRAVPKSDRLRQHLGLGPQVRIALYQGYLQPDRSLDLLIRAARFLEQDIFIVLMGKGEEATLSQLETLIASQGVADRVKILPPIPYEELLDWTASADIGLTLFSPDYSLSIRLTLPNKLFEYLMAGLPVLTSPLDAIVEVIRTYDVGQVVSSLAPADVGAAINSMLADREALARMRRNALEAAKDEFYWEKESRELIHLYHDILAAPPPARVCMHILSNACTDVRTKRAATALAEADFTVSIIDIESEGARPAEEDIGGVCVKHIIVPKSFIATRFKRWALVRAAWMLMLGMLRLMRTPADIYHALDLPAFPACYIAAKLRRKPVIFEAYELPLSILALSEMSTSRRWLHALLVPLLGIMMPRCAGVITVSPPIVDEFRRLFHAPEVSLVRNIPPYRAVPKSDRLRQHLGLGPQVRIALYQGYLQPDRSLDLLIRAARFLEQDIFIVLMGKGEEATLSQLETLIASQGVADRVKILPPVPYEELLDWTASADIGLIVYTPDYVRNVQMMLPNKLFEYLMAGLPVLTSPLEAVTEIINICDVGQVVSSLAPADVGAAINSMLADREALARMRRNALEAAKDEFYWEKESQELIRLYHDILAARNAKQ